MTETPTPPQTSGSAKPGTTAARPARDINARTAQRQKILFASLGVVALLGAGWIVLGGEDDAASEEGGAQTIETAGLVNRDLSNREFQTVYGNRVSNVEAQQKKLAENQIPRSELEAQLAAIQAENQAMRTDGQAAIDAISAENAELKTRLATQESAPPPAPLLPAYGPQAGGYDARAPRAAPGAPTSASATPSDLPGPAEAKLLGSVANMGHGRAASPSWGIRQHWRNAY